MSNNPILFNAAFAGAYGALYTSRNIVSSTAGTYTAQIADAFAFAFLVDSDIAPDQSITQQDGNVLLSICEQVLVGKGATGVNATTAAAIAAAFNAARASLVPGTNFGAQTQWAIDPVTGNDNNIGTPALPLRTMGEFNKRFRNLTVSVAATLQCVGNVIDAPLTLAGTFFTTGASLTASGTRTSITAAVITITVVAAEGPAGAAPFLLTTTGIDWTTVPLTTQVRINDTSVSNIVEVVGVNQVRIGAFATATGNTFGTPPVGGIITLFSLSRSLPFIISATSAAFFNAPASPPVFIQDLAVDAPTTITNSFFFSGNIAVTLFGCQLANTVASTLQLQAPVVLKCCRYTVSATLTVRSNGESSLTNGCVIAGTGATIFNTQSGYFGHVTCTFTGARLFCTSSNMFFSGHIRNTAGPIVTQGGGSLQLQNAVNGANNTGIGIDTPSGTTEYFSASKPTVTGGSDCRVGGVARTYAQIPFINATLDAIPPTVTTLTGNGAKIVLAA